MDRVSNVAVEVGNKTNDRTCTDWQALCVPDLNVGNNWLRLFTEGDDLHDAMISAVEGAQRSIRLEVFIFAADEIGWQFARTLSAKARAGVEVRFHFDSRGAATRYSPDLFREMADAGLSSNGTVRGAGVIRAVIFKGITENSSLSTSRNCSSEVLTSGEKTPARFTGRGDSGIPTSRSGVSLPGMRQPCSIRCGMIQSTHTRMAPLSRHQSSILRWCRVLSASAGSGSHVCTPGSIESSVRHVYITTPYFCPGSIVARAARQASGRGVDVRLLVP